MSTYWKEVVNFDDDNFRAGLTLCVEKGRGVCEFTSLDLQSGRIVLLLKDGEAASEFALGCCTFNFETSSQWYYVLVFQGEKLVLSGGNSKNLQHEYEVPKIIATDAFEEKVANFNYFEKELGENGKDAESVLSMQKAEKDADISQIQEVKTVAKTVDDIKTTEEKVINIMNKTEKIQDDGMEVENVDIIKETKNSKPKQTNPQRKTNAARKKAQRKSDFFELAKPQVEKMIAKFPKEEFLEDVLENSKWVKVEFSKNVHYAVGIIYADDMAQYIGYGVLGSAKKPPQFENPQFVPFDIADPNGDGYFLIFQRADTGEKV